MSIHWGNGFPAAFLLVALVAALVALAIGALWVAAWCFIFRRAGYPWALGILMLIPGVNFIVPLVLGFSKWPVENELDLLRAAMRLQAQRTAGACVPPPCVPGPVWPTQPPSAPHC